MAVEFALAADSAKSFWFVVNHWKSRLGGMRETEPSRMSSVRELGSFYLNTARQSSPAMVLTGDFNAEPGEWPFQVQAAGPGRPNQLMAVRERPLVLRDKLKLAWFYNPMWRWLAEPELWEHAAGQPRSRPIGSHCQNPAADAGWALFDQVMANRWAMEAKPLRLIEGSVRLVEPVGGCSDHWAVAAQFDH
ncbi:MAG: hypothetical protein HYU66_22170 [Armatimonadetes bacterium]|nr:hypothetical protein [Armatimonadota bacterium]